MGRKFDEVNEEMKMVPYRVEKDDQGRAVVKSGNMEQAPIFRPKCRP